MSTEAERNIALSDAREKLVYAYLSDDDALIAEAQSDLVRAKAMVVPVSATVKAMLDKRLAEVLDSKENN